VTTTASKVADLKHKHSIERDALDQQHAAAEARLRSGMDAERKDKDAAQLRGRQIDAGERYDRDEQYSHERAAAVRRLYAKQDTERSKMDERHAKALEAVRSQPSDNKPHEVKTSPQLGDPDGDIWKDLDGPRRNAITAIRAKYARSRDQADSEILDLNRNKNLVAEDLKSAKMVRSRYGKPGTHIAAQLDDADVEKHLALLKRERGELTDKVIQYGKELADAHARYLRQQDERAAMASRHAAENRAR
jgi:hypothetical protein